MPAPNYASLVAPLRAAAVDAAWAQWGVVGFGAAAKTQARAIVDPEALILASLAFERDLRRFGRVMQIWIGAGSHLLSVGRMTNLARDYPAFMHERVAGFAAEAVAQGDARWRKLAGKAVGRGSRRQRATSARAQLRTTPDLRLPATLMLRLRLALGVGIKADALTYLLGCVGARATVRGIAQGTGYFDRAVRRAVEDLVAARFVEILPTSPTSFVARWARWEQVLDVSENHAPIWRSWHQLYVCTHSLLVWAKEADRAQWAPYVAASRLRDVFDRMAPHFAQAFGHEHPDWDRAPEEWLGGTWITEMAERLRGVV